VTNPRTRRRKSIIRALPEATVVQAQRWRDDQVSIARDTAHGRTPQKMRFAQFAASLYARKVATGDLGSPKSRERWEDTLTLHLIPRFGDMFCHEIKSEDVREWRDELAARVERSRELRRKPTLSKEEKGALLSPATANGWFSIMRILCKDMVLQHRLGADPCAALRNIDESTNRTYTFEQPNALTPELARRFVETVRALYRPRTARTPHAADSEAGAGGIDQ